MRQRDRIVDIIAGRISHFDYENQDEIIEMLALIGIKHYSIMYPNEPLHISALNILCG